jgi:micrococcal nuclease
MEKYIYRGKLDRVVDGDTIDAMIDVGFNIWLKKRVRFKGIDTWESRTRDLAEKAKGLEAKARLIELLDKVSEKPGFFRIKSYGVGKYGRLLGEIFIMDKDENPN